MVVDDLACIHFQGPDFSRESAQHLVETGKTEFSAPKLSKQYLNSKGGGKFCLNGTLKHSWLPLKLSVMQLLTPLW